MRRIITLRTKAANSVRFVYGPMDGMYGPLQPWIDQSWRPGEIELVK